MSIDFNVSPYFQTPNFGQVSDSATRGRTQEINAGFLGKGKLLEAIDMADMLEKTANYTGDATRYAGTQMGNTAMFAGAMDGIKSVGYGMYKAGHFDP